MQMATDDNTSTNVSHAPSALRVAERYPLVAPIVEREFKRICPTLELIDFNSCSTDIHWIVFSGTEAELLRLRVIDSSMIAVKPKRVFRSDNGRDHIKTTRLAGDRIEVRMDLNESLDRAHPLGPLASWNWEALVEKAEGRPSSAAGAGKAWRPPSLLTARCPPELQAARRQALLAIAQLQSAAYEFPQIEDEIRRRLLSLEDLLRRETERRAPQAKAARPSYLRLVVDNEARR
jgi:hypothetical protein